jgi:bacterioferritin
MKGNSEIIECLNTLLTNELTAIDQYLVQSRMLEDWGYVKLQARIGHEADDERGHVEKLIKRILFLEGEPDVASRVKLKIGKNPKDMLANDLELELQVAEALNAAIALCRDKRDNGTRELLEELLRDTELDHIFWLEQQLNAIEELGLENYLQEQL